MKTEELEKYINKKIENCLNCRLISSGYEFTFYLIFIIFIFIVILLVIRTFIHNNDVKERVKMLDFCDSIYKSDHVVLEQCKDYFIIYGSDD